VIGVFILWGSEKMGMGLGLKRSSLGMMIIFALIAVSLFSFPNLLQNAYAPLPDFTVSVTTIGEPNHTIKGLALWVGDYSSSEGLMTGTTSNPLLLSVSPGDGYLRAIDKTNGATLESLLMTINDGCDCVGGTEPITYANGLAVDPTGPTLYAIVNAAQLAGRHLVTIDPITGVATDLGALDGNFAGLAYDDSSNTLYGITGSIAGIVTTKDTLYKLTTDGLATASDPLPLVQKPGQTIAFNHDDGMIYYAAGGGSTPVTFEKINPADNSITPILINLDNGFISNREVSALTYSVLDAKFIWSDKLSGGTLYSVSVIPLSPTSPPPPTPGFALYGIAYTGSGGASTLYTINTGTGAAAPVGPIGFNQCGAMDFSSIGTLYATCVTTDISATPVLVTINTATGLGTQVGTGTGLSSQITDMSFRNSDGKLFAFDSTSGNLNTIDTGTGVGTPVGLVSLFGNGNAMDFSTIDTLYFAVSGTWNKLDQNSGAGTHLGNLIFPSGPYSGTYCPRLNAMDFEPGSGVLFASLRNGNICEASSANSLVTVDNTITGIVTTIGATQLGLDAIAFGPAAQHHTALIANIMYPANSHGVKWGKTFTVNATLVDTDNGNAAIVGESSALFSFNGTGTSVGTIGSVPAAAGVTDGFGVTPATTLTASGAGSVGIQNVNAKFAGDANYYPSSGNTAITILPHVTALSATNMIPKSPPGVKWSNTFTANATLTDVDNGNAAIVGEPSALFSFNGTGTSVGTLGSVPAAAGVTDGFGVTPATTLTASGAGTVGTQNVNAKFAGDADYLGSSSNTPITILKHVTTLALNPIVSPFAGNEFSANGELDDADMGNVGIPNKSITFTGTGSAGLVAPTTSGITFTDSSPNLSVSSCSLCSGTVNVMRLHTGSTISIPSTPPYVELFGADMGGATFSIQVTYVGGSTGTFTSPSIPSGTIVPLALTSPGNVGISSIQITGVSSGLAGISKVKTFDRILGQVIETTFPASIPVATTMSFNQGEFFSVGTTSPTPITGLTVQASFAEDPDYFSSTSPTKTFNTYFSTTAGVAGIGGAETSTPDVGRMIPAKTCDSSGLDVDNLCKSWKGTTLTSGIPYAYGTYIGGASSGTTYYKLPASCAVGQKCVLVEADSMLNFAPNSASLADVTTAFANHGVSLFIQPSSSGTLNTLDENNLQLANNLAVWTDADNTFTNDFDSIKASHFGTASERPILSTTQSATILSTPTPTTSSQTLEISGITIITRNTGAPGGVTEGTLSVKVKLPMPSATTLTTGTITQPIPQNSKLIFGPISTAVNSKATYKILTITVPFDTTGTILTAASFGSIDIQLILSGSAPPIPLVPDSNLSLTPVVTTNLIDAKAQAYRYLLFVSSIGGPNPPGPSGIVSSAPGNKAIVALGASIFSVLPPTEQQQAGTIMHELGHLLGLAHGGPTSAGDATINCKPNYASVMSYSRQLPTYLGSDWKLDYSIGVLPDLDEAHLTDVAGTPKVTSGTVTPVIVWGTPSGTLQHTATSSTTYDKKTSVTSATPPDIDWLGNGVTAGNIVAPISGFGTSGCTETVAGTQFTGAYHDYNDWNNLNFNFQTGSGASALTGASDVALFTSGDDQIVGEPHSDYNGPILQAQIAASSVFPGLSDNIRLDGTSVFSGGSSTELEFQLFVSGTKITKVETMTTKTNFVGDVAPYIFAKITTNDPFNTALNGQIIAAKGKFKLDKDDDGDEKNYVFNWKMPTVKKTTKVYISVFVQPPSLTTTPPALSSVLIPVPLKDTTGKIVTAIITLKPFS
jgi:hypothetical protein